MCCLQACSAARCALAESSPEKCRQADRLPGEIGRKYKKPRHPVALAQFTAKRIEKAAETAGPVVAEHLPANEEYRHGQ